MRELRKVQQAVERYNEALVQRPWIIKENLKEYQDDIEILISFMNSFQKQVELKLKKTIKKYLSLPTATDPNLLVDLKDFINVKITCYNLKKYSKKKKDLENLNEDLKQIKNKLMQFECFS